MAGYPTVREAKAEARAWLLKSWQERVRRYKRLPAQAFDEVYDRSEVYIVCDSEQPQIFVAGAVVEKGGAVVHFLHTKSAFRSSRYEEVLLDVVSPETALYTTHYDRLLVARPDVPYKPFWTLKANVD